jgi:hypothetical protein
MSIDTKYTQRLEFLIDQIAARDPEYIDTTWDLLLWSHYGQDVLSQYGYGVYAWNFRQQNGTTRLCIKAMESGVPLVAFVSSATPTGCIEQMFRLLEKGILRWQKDKYPAI